MSEDLKTAELEALRSKADLLGVQYHPSIGYEKLLEKIRAHEAAAEAAANGQKNTGAGEPAADTPAVSQAAAVETQAQKLRRLREDATKLVRIRLTCLNPAKKEWPGEIITAGNSVLGSFKKFVPFAGADDGYHVPNIIFQVLKDRTCPVYYTDKSLNGVGVRRHRLIKEFAIEVLPQLSREEIDELARRQALAGSVG
jgi:hypothetical protein